MDDREPDLEAAIEDLVATLEALQGELETPPRGPFGLPRPPTPGEFLRLTEGYAIPAVVSLLEASIRTLELLAAAIRVADGRPLDGGGARRGAGSGRTDRLATASRETLAKLDDALADLQSAAAGGEPDNPELQRLISEARSLRGEGDDRLAAATDSRPATAGDPEPVDIEVENGGDAADDADQTENPQGDATGSATDRIDVDSELESIKRELDDDSTAAAAGDEDGGEDSEGRAEPPGGDESRDDGARDDDRQENAQRDDGSDSDRDEGAGGGPDRAGEN
jgi:hypothetical protein